MKKRRLSAIPISLLFLLSLLEFRAPAAAEDGRASSSAAGRASGRAAEAPGKVPRDDKILRIGVGRGNPPYSFEQDGEATGYWVDLVRETAVTLGYEPEIRADVWDAVKSDLAAGRLDVAVAMADLPERRAVYDFTVPVSTYSYALWVRRDSPIRSSADLGGKRLVAQRGSAIADRIGSYAPDAVVSLVPEDADALVLLDSGRYDAAMLSLVQGLYFARKLKLSEVRPLAGSVLSLDQCFAVARGNGKLARELDAGLNALKVSGRLDVIYSKWLGVYERPPPARAPAWVPSSLAVVALLLAASLAFVFVLRSTVRRRTAELAANERKYRALSETLPQMIFLKDRDSNYVSCNRRYAEALGISPDEIAGRNDYDFYPRDLAEKYRADDRAAARGGGSLDVIERWRGPEGETWINTVKTAMRDDEGRVVGVVGIFWDVSDRLRMEEGMRRSIREKETLLREVNHRVKNNLQLINAIIRLELSEKPSPEVERFVTDTAARISSIAAVHELLYASDDLSEIKVDGYLRHISRGLLDTYSRPDRGIDISVDAGDTSLDLSRMVSLGLIVNEMITNSLKYAFDGRPAGRISIRMVREGVDYLFNYEDDGCGLAADFDDSGRKSLGMVFIESQAKQLEGQVSMRSAGGLSYELRFGGDGASRSP
jgi:PAS domain S-box-containing protein